MSDWGEVVGQADGLPQLPVSLSVKLIRPNEDSATFLGSMQEDTIGREGLVLVDFDYVADTNILSSLQIPVSVGVKVLVFLIVSLFVLPPPLDVVERLLGHRDQQHEHQWRYIREQVSHLQWWHELRERDEEEEQVVEELELIEKYDRYECNDVILVILQLIRHESARRSTSIHADSAFLT